MSTVVEQRMITLPFLDDEVAALILSDGKIYFPVYKVCQALGIHSDRHIRRWKTLALWFTARKLPFRTEKQGKRQVWCLPISSVPFLYGLFDWHCVSPERRLRLKRACQEQATLADLAYQDMQQNYKAVRKGLFTFLANSAEIDSRLQRYSQVLSPTHANGSTLILLAHIERGRSLYKEATDHARKMVRDQEELPIIEAYTIDADDHVIDTFSLPLLPVVPLEDGKRFHDLMKQLTVWWQEFRMVASELESESNNCN